ncbi:S-adenosyl-L-methionine-dependent methyltransferase [Pisolithus croceorrhizus]|nr:S-adenosyl-L-methionine-dependent methyltransferase [Pisolithus croceorrhizus]
MVSGETSVTTRHAWRAQVEQEQRVRQSLPACAFEGSVDSYSDNAVLTPSVDPPSPPGSAPTSPLTNTSDLSDDDYWPPSPKRRRIAKAVSASPKRKHRREKCSRIRRVTRDHTLADGSPASLVSSSRAASRQRSLALDEPIYRCSSSRSSSTFRPPPEPGDKVDRIWWTVDNGSPGPDLVSAASVVRRLAKSYKSYFNNPQDPDDKSFEAEALPSTELEYPNNHSCETFILLVPKDPDHYNPIMCLVESLYTIIDCYLTPPQKALFGTLPTALPSEHPPPPSPPTSSVVNLSGDLSNSSHNSGNTAQQNHLRTLQRAIRRRDGPLFLHTMDTINFLLRSLKYPPLPDDVFEPALPNQLLTYARESWAEPPYRGIPKRVLLRVIEETYQRIVGPNIGQLSRYSAFTSEVYGELMPSFTDKIIVQTGLHAGSLLVDLGSGVGNVLLHAALATGCSAFGVEFMAGPAALAREQLRQLRTRCRMWGLSLGNVELEEGDMLASRRVDALLPKADVVVVNNKVFEETLNAALRPKFLDLKEGAVVISLKPFVQPNARVTERNVDDICAIFDVEERPYHSGDVSWGSSGGSYYAHRVDRIGYASIRERFENARARSVRAGRR